VINKATGIAGERCRRALCAEDSIFINYVAYMRGSSKHPTRWHRTKWNFCFVLRHKP